MSEKELTSFRGKQLGIIFQQFHLMNSLTALENVSLPLEIASIPKAHDKALKALDLVGLSHRAKHLPHQLSGGECQRVAIARAFVTEPKLLLADEPSGNLDQETGQMVMNLLFDAVKKRNMTMILVTHDDDLANRCQRKLLLKNGTLIPVGV
jgi:putative ABC transport system ATP-binding protein